jgi:hypothetical protein
LNEKEPAQAGRCIVQRRSGFLQIMRTCQLDEAIAQVLALQKSEHDEDRDNPCRGQRSQQRRDQRCDALERRGWRLADLDRYRLGLLPWRRHLRRRGRARGRVLRLVELLAQVLQHVGGTLEGAAGRGRAAQRLDLLTHGELIARQLTGELGHLRRDHAADHEDAHEGEQNDADDGYSPRDAPALQQPNERREHEAQKNRQRNRDEYFAAEIERSDDDRRNHGRCDTTHGRHRLSERRFASSLYVPTIASCKKCSMTWNFVSSRRFSNH